LFIAGNPVVEDRAYMYKSVDLCPKLIRLDVRTTRSIKTQYITKSFVLAR